MKNDRPAVSIEPICNADGDLTHCVITAGNLDFKALFSEPHHELENRIQLATDIDLQVSEVMMVTKASRRQMEREAERLKQRLLAMPHSTIAIVDGDMFFWLDAEQELVWEQWITVGQGRLSPGYISCIGEIDTHELWDLAESIRAWLAHPQTVLANPQWLNQQY